MRPSGYLTLNRTKLQVRFPSPRIPLPQYPVLPPETKKNNEKHTFLNPPGRSTQEHIKSHSKSYRFTNEIKLATATLPPDLYCSSNEPRTSKKKIAVVAPYTDRKTKLLSPRPRPPLRQSYLFPPHNPKSSSSSCSELSNKKYQK